ncbi:MULTISPECIES: acyltransferase family protein [Hyphomonas]|uniref:acyltransferase family protein n=1 Tax=Hyphomonas TaxID=85 RepID=UPI0035126E42
MSGTAANPALSSVQRFHALDGMRGIAAIVVMLYHYVGASQSRLFMNSYIAVDLFFILSGFVIYHAYATAILGGMPAGVFANKRISRLAPTVAGGVVLGAIAALIVMLETGRDFSPLDFALTHMGHFAFVPALSDYQIPASDSLILFPSNPPLWSIFYELVASLAFIWIARIPRWRLVGAALAAFSLYLFCCLTLSRMTGTALTANVGWNHATFFFGFPRVFSGFLMGIIIYRLLRRLDDWIETHLPRLAGPLPTLGLFAATLCVLMCPFYAKGVYQFVAIGMLCPLLILVGARVTPGRSWLTAVCDGLGTLSFPLYCVHEPVRHMTNILLKRIGLPDSALGLRVTITVILAFLASGMLLWLLGQLRARHRLSSRLKPFLG